MRMHHFRLDKLPDAQVLIEKKYLTEDIENLVGETDFPVFSNYGVRLDQASFDDVIGMIPTCLSIVDVGAVDYDLSDAVVSRAPAVSQTYAHFDVSIILRDGRSNPIVGSSGGLFSIQFLSSITGSTVDVDTQTAANKNDGSFLISVL